MGRWSRRYGPSKGALVSSRNGVNEGHDADMQWVRVWRGRGGRA